MYDTISLDFAGHPMMQGLGPLEAKQHNGFFVQLSLLLSVCDVPLGIAAARLSEETEDVPIDVIADTIEDKDAVGEPGPKEE